MAGSFSGDQEPFEELVLVTSLIKGVLTRGKSEFCSCKKVPTPEIVLRPSEQEAGA